jgi:hypothetical protein
MTNLSTAVAYDDSAMREDLLAILQNISPTETQLVSGLGTSAATNIRHETLVDTLSAVKVNAQQEGATATYHELTNPSRIANYCQIFKQGFKVSDTERSVNQAAFNDRYQYEATKALKLIKNDMEFALMRGSYATGSGTGARYLNGIKNSLSLVTSQSGTSLSEKILNDYLQLVWDNTGVQVNAVYGSMYIKRKISAFSANGTKYFTQDDRRLINAVDVYQADAASMVKLFAHRYVTTSTDTSASLNYDIVGLNEDFFKIAYLRKPLVEQMAKTGDSTDGQVVVECTLEPQHYNAGFYGKGYL